MTKIKRLNHFILISALNAIILVSCYERKEGCLDMEASNFDFTADDACGECCTDPVFSVSVRHLTNNYLINPDSVLFTNLGQSYKIINFSYYLSGFELIMDDGRKISISETIEFKSPDGNTITTPDDFKIWRLTNPSHSLGKLREYGNVRQITFILGVKDDWLTYEPVNLPLNHVLNDSLKLQRPDGTLVHQRISIVQGEEFQDTLNLFVKGIGGSVTYNLDTVFTKPIGQNMNLVIKADYSKWLLNSDLQKKVSEIEMALKENSKGIFSVN
ncbi:MAG: hypothetical protein IPM42_02945 [Saprospiraceae bacterium]|nr:hypothetical protein [Saprospiraceae bacterium]